MPWALIRESARPEDVCQGAIGNCWMAGALSVVAAQDWLISKMFITKHFNRWGAYQIQLHHSGEWKGVLIDDLLPTAKIFEGFADGNMIHYSRGGTLSYLNCARRQLWVPLLEKASAKLFGSYGGLVSGTFSEALQVLRCRCVGMCLSRFVLFGCLVSLLCSLSVCFFVYLCLCCSVTLSRCLCYHSTISAALFL